MSKVMFGLQSFPKSFCRSSHECNLENGPGKTPRHLSHEIADHKTETAAAEGTKYTERSTSQFKADPRTDDDTNYVDEVENRYGTSRARRLE
jgi:hypothetical protein